MSDLPESFYATPLEERLRDLAEMPMGTAPEDMPKWMLDDNLNWGAAFKETCREAAERIALVDEFIESSKRIETEFKALREELAKLGIKTGGKNAH